RSSLAPRTANLRYSDLRARPSSKTTIDATTLVPCKLETSKHSIRSGGTSRPSASWISCMAWLRVDRSLARLVLCKASDSVAFLDLVHNPATLSAHPAVAHVEDLDGGLELIFDQPDHVAVGAVRQHHCLLFQRTLERLQVIAEPGGPLELLGLRGLVHLRLEP